MAEEYRRSIYVEEIYDSISARIRQANLLFAKDGTCKKRYERYYNELLWRQEFLITAINTLAKVADNKTNTDTMLQEFDDLYCFSLDDEIYATEEEKDDYVDKLKLLREKYPYKEEQIALAVRKIIAAIKKEMAYTKYLQSLKNYVEVLVDFFLWMREMVSPVPPSKQNDTKGGIKK